MDATYDLVVIGGGPGGYTAAIRASQLGMKVAVVEKEEMGGVCLNWGCIPSKALLRNAEVVNLVRNAAQYGITLQNLQFDIASAIDRSRKVVETRVKGVGFLMRKNKIDVVKGGARLAAANKVAVDAAGRTLTAKNVIIATGAQARDLPGLVRDGKTIITAREALELRQTPKSIAIVGGGAIGCEMAYFYRSYGAEVTVIEMLPHLVPNEDEEVSRELERAFAKMGIGVKAGFTVEKAEARNGLMQLTLGPAQEGGTVDCEKVLLGVGVKPNSDGLGLEPLGVQTTKGYIAINDRMATNVPGIYAIGDVTGKLLLAHVASAQGVQAAEAIAGRPVRPLAYSDMPRATYCQPQVASMGLTEKAAKEKGYDVKVGKFPFMANGKATAIGASDGFVKLVVAAKTGEIIGAHLVGHDVTEMLAEISITKMLEGTALEIGKTVHAHPTLSEAIKEASLGAYGEAIDM
ncbi:MAG: dihydrolipoyl dehydrogenase [Chloroflexi bacterium]|nr:dihydrolipoyl dehydrogenase [Chloroflexota bacterium]